jgi:hypothetical protein
MPPEKQSTRNSAPLTGKIVKFCRQQERGEGSKGGGSRTCKVTKQDAGSRRHMQAIPARRYRVRAKKENKAYAVNTY